MALVYEARKLVNFIGTLEDFDTLFADDGMTYEHIGALFTDIILQAGLNYNTVVKPRVQHVLQSYPGAYTLSGFKRVIEQNGLSKVIKWTHSIKLSRMEALIEFSLANGINTCDDMKNFLSDRKNQSRICDLKGIGPKTLDYTMKLLSFDTVAVDRHIYSFIALASIEVNGYTKTKKIVEYSADLMDISRTTIDYSIWHYMSQVRNRSRSIQGEFAF